MNANSRNVTLTPLVTRRAFQTTGLFLFVSLLSSPLAFSPEVQHQFQVPGLGAYAQFGTSVAVSGDTVVVGCPSFVVDNDWVGAAFVYVFRDGQWIHQATFIPDGASADTEFGYSVAISQDTIVVGAYRDSEFSRYSGAAYVFIRTQDVWTFEAKLSPADAHADLQFGNPVAIDGDRIVVGAIADNDMALASGAVYLFQRESNTWRQEAKLKPIIPRAGALFGLSVSLRGGLLAVGAPFATHNSLRSAGAAYVFECVDNVWVEMAELTAADATANSLFGWSVAVAPNRVFAGAPRAQQGSAASGAVYLFQQLDPDWSQTQKLTDSNPANNAWFGFSVALHEDVAAVGASQDLEFGSNAGALSLYSPQDELWQQTLKFNTTPPSPGSQLGFSLAFDGNHLVAGAPFHGSAPFPQTGAAFAFSPSAPPLNQPPIADASATPAHVLAALNASYAEVRLDGSHSSDPDSPVLAFRWFEDETLIADTETAVVQLALGRHTILLEVSDGSGTSTDSLELDIIAPSQAIDQLIDQLHAASLPNGQSHALEQFLVNARRAADRNQLYQTLHHLQVARNYLLVQAGKRLDPLAARILSDAIRHLAETLRGA